MLNLASSEPAQLVEGGGEEVASPRPGPATGAPEAPVPADPGRGSRAPSGVPGGGGLAAVLHHPGIWRRSAPTTNLDAQPTGFAGLDALLPGGGWPRGALSEVLVDADGIGEFALVAPALAALTRAGRRVVLVAPPYVPYAPAFAAAGIDLTRLVQIDARALDRHWSAEQCLRAGCCAAVLNWLPDADYRQLRRLQLAAETGAALGFVFRPAAAASQASPAALRLRLHAGEAGPALEIVKCRGGLAGHRHGSRGAAFLPRGQSAGAIRNADAAAVPEAGRGALPAMHSRA